MKALCGEYKGASMFDKCVLVGVMTRIFFRNARVSSLFPLDRSRLFLLELGKIFAFVVSQ